MELYSSLHKNPSKPSWELSNFRKYYDILKITQKI